MTGRSL